MIPLKSVYTLTSGQISHRGVNPSQLRIFPHFRCISPTSSTTVCTLRSCVSFLLVSCFCVYASLLIRESAKAQTICLRDLEREARHLCVYPLSGTPHTAVPPPFVSVPVVKCKLPLAPSATAQRCQDVAPKQSGASAKCQSCCFQASQT